MEKENHQGITNSEYVVLRMKILVSETEFLFGKDDLKVSHFKTMLNIFKLSLTPGVKEKRAQKSKAEKSVYDEQ